MNYPPFTVPNSPIATFIDFLVPHLESPPTVKVVPKVVKLLNVFLLGIHLAQRGDRLSLAESSFSGKDGSVGGDYEFGVKRGIVDQVSEMVRPCATMLNVLKSSAETSLALGT